MLRASFAVIGMITCGACGSAKPDVIEDMPPPEALEKPVTVDSGELEIRVAGGIVGTETFEVTRHVDRLTTVAEGQTNHEGVVRFKAEMVHALDWSAERYRTEVDTVNEKCVFSAQRKGREMHATRESNGKTEDLPVEPIDHARYFYGMQPSSMQLVACALAADEPRRLTYYPGFTAHLAAREPIQLASAPDRKLTRVRVDDRIDILCEGDKFILLHYPKHALTITRAGNAPIAAELSASDPTSEPWFGKLACR
jgi:hypothetical protein